MRTIKSKYTPVPKRVIQHKPIQVRYYVKKIVNRIKAQRRESQKELVSKPLPGKSRPGRKPRVAGFNQKSILSCKKRLQRNDQVRRSNFFRARGAGGSQRPAHKRKFDRKC